jgi:hypothetical protein
MLSETVPIEEHSIGLLLHLLGKPSYIDEESSQDQLDLSLGLKEHEQQSVKQ